MRLINAQRNAKVSPTNQLQDALGARQAEVGWLTDNTGHLLNRDNPAAGGTGRIPQTWGAAVIKQNVSVLVSFPLTISD